MLLLNNKKINECFFFRKKFFILILFFSIWMFFFDTNSLIVHYNLYKESKELKKKIIYLKSKIQTEKNWIKKIKSNSDYIEKFAREKFHMKYDKEDIFIIPNN